MPCNEFGEFVRARMQRIRASMQRIPSCNEFIAAAAGDAAGDADAAADPAEDGAAARTPAVKSVPVNSAVHMQHEFLKTCNRAKHEFLKRTNS